jgi:hypothetical protein
LAAFVWFIRRERLAYKVHTRQQGDEASERQREREGTNVDVDDELELPVYSERLGKEDIALPVYSEVPDEDSEVTSSSDHERQVTEPVARDQQV